jgi:UDP-2,4-diacetamido-2,4,6-trideoxy-beta-L-altropyranose hydrolase
MAKQKTILIRADASTVIGTGHVMRCLALAQAWQDAGGAVVFALASASSSLRQRLLQESCTLVEVLGNPGSLEDAHETLRLAEEISACWIVVDGYHFGSQYQRALKLRGARILILDDFAHAETYSADLVLNQNIFAQATDYASTTSSQLLLGPQYCLLRREFQAWRQSDRQTPSIAHRVLVTMGGSDPGNITSRATHALNLIEDDLEVAIVLGGSNQNSGDAEALAANCNKKVNIYNDPSNMAELMAWGDVALSAAGTTSWELCFMGVPAVLISVAPNQIPIAKGLSHRGCAIDAGKAADISPNEIAQSLRSLLRSEKLRTEIATRGRELIDGNGPRRVVSALFGFGLRLREAQHSDAELLWQWANDPEVRAASFSSDPIPWKTHLQWFMQKLNQLGCSILIAEDEDGTPVGQVRFDPRGDGDVDIAVSIAKACRGHGFAVSLITKAVNWLRAACNSPCIHAYVKTGNASSIKAFERAGFQQVNVTDIKGHMAIHYVRQLESICAVNAASKSSVAVLQES